MARCRRRWGAHPGAIHGWALAEMDLFDRRLLDGAHEVHGYGERFVTGFLAHDDLNQQHLVDRRKEVDANEVFGALGVFRQI